MSVQIETQWSALSSIVGGDHLRPATSADAVDGVQPQMVIEPGSATELAQVLSWCAEAADLSVIPCGGGTKLDWGGKPRRADLILSTARLNRVIEHAWGDMTATVEAGCRVDAFQQVLAEHNQRLAFDPLWPQRATIGGVLATNDSGALRYAFGSLRDLIIGITIALPDGTLAKSGGKVVKNVAGFDLPKLLTGSLGTLGVITEATFRLYPLPRESRTLCFAFSTFARMNGFVLAVQDSSLAAASLQICAEEMAAPEVCVRFEGSLAAIEVQARQVAELSGDAKQIDRLPGAVWESREKLWQEGQGGGQEVNETSLVCKLSVLPAQLCDLCELVQRVAAELRLKWRIVGQGYGVCLLRLDDSQEASQKASQGASPGASHDALHRETLLDALARLRNEVERVGGSLVVLRCPLEIKAALDVWGTTAASDDALGLMQRVKQQFDPTGMLNPGRFVGGI